jgi:chaperone protein EcpD
MFGIFRFSALGPTLFTCMATLVMASYMPASRAALTISGTRVVFESDKRSVSLIVTNPGTSVYAVQTWINTATDDTTTSVPFISSPPLFRLDGGKEQQVQINGLPNELPKDRESLFYFNVQEIPHVEAGNNGNFLNIALRSRLKLFYRPSELKDSPAARMKDLKWSINTVSGNSLLRVDNPTPFHVSFIRIGLSGAGQQEHLSSPAMVEPMSSQTYPLSAIKASNDLRVTFSAINDYGATTPPLSASVDSKF